MSRPPRLSLVYLTVITLGLVGVAVVVHNNRGTARVARQLYASARTDTTPATTVDDARRWLEANGFHVVTRDGVFVSTYFATQDTTKQPDYLFVRGIRGVRGFLPYPDRWVELLYRFHPDGTFDTLLLDLDATSPPEWSRPLAPTTTPAAGTMPVEG